VNLNLTKVHYTHIWKYHNETPLYNPCMLIKKRRKKENRWSLEMKGIPGEGKAVKVMMEDRKTKLASD
jgi:hypothetical protein